MEEKNQDFWNNYVKRYDYNPNFIKEVPIEFQTQEMWNQYVENGVIDIFGIRNYVPEKFQTRAMWEKFYSFKSPDFVKKVPEKFQTTKMWERYLEKNNYFYSNVGEVPLCYQTQDMWDKSMKELGYNPYFVQEVPKKFISLEILRNVVENKPNHKQYDFYFFEKKLDEMEKQEKERKEIEKSYITNQERDYETGSRADFDNENDYGMEL